jgi:hypothetical protein
LRTGANGDGWAVFEYDAASDTFTPGWRLVRSIVAMLVSSAAAIRLSLQPSPISDTSAFSRMRAFVSSWAERLPLRINSSSRARSSADVAHEAFLLVFDFALTLTQRQPPRPVNMRAKGVRSLAVSCWQAEALRPKVLRIDQAHRHPSRNCWGC